LDSVRHVRQPVAQTEHSSVRVAESSVRLAHSFAVPPV
jgi:hypothetical protein